MRPNPCTHSENAQIKHLDVVNKLVFGFTPSVGRVVNGKTALKRVFYAINIFYSNYFCALKKKKELRQSRFSLCCFSLGLLWNKNLFSCVSFWTGSGLKTFSYHISNSLYDCTFTYIAKKL